MSPASSPYFVSGQFSACALCYEEHSLIMLANCSVTGLMWWGRWDLNPGSPTPQAGILNQSRDAGTSIHDNSPNPDIQAIRRPHGTSLRPSVEGRIVNTLIRLKGSGLARARAVRYIKAYTSKQRCSVSSAFDCGLRCHAQIHADPIPHRKTSRGNTDNLLLDIQILQKNTTALYVY